MCIIISWALLEFFFPELLINLMQNFFWEIYKLDSIQMIVIQMKLDSTLLKHLNCIEDKIEEISYPNFLRSTLYNHIKQ